MDATTTVGFAMILIGLLGMMSRDDGAGWVMIAGAALVYFFSA